MSTHDAAADSLDALAQVLEALRATRSRLEKRRLVVGYLQALPDEALPLAVTYLGGRPVPRVATAACWRSAARRWTPRCGQRGPELTDEARRRRLAPPRRRGRRRRRALDRRHAGRSRAPPD